MTIKLCFKSGDALDAFSFFFEDSRSVVLLPADGCYA